MKFNPIDTMPRHDGGPFLVLCHGNAICDFLIIQVSVFEGSIYPDALDGAIDWDDRVTGAIGWCEIGDIRKPETIDG